MSAHRGYRLVVPRGASPTSTPLRAEPRAVAEYAMAARLEATLQLAECASRLGPVISFHTSLLLPGLQARITFRDRPDPDDLPVQEASVIVPLVLPGEHMDRPPLTLRGAPTRPVLTLGLFDRDRGALGPERRVCECGDGSYSVEFPVQLVVSAVVWLSAQGVSGTCRPSMRVSGKLVFSRGVTAELGQGPAAANSSLDPVSSELPLVNPGAMFFFYERSVESGLPGNPWVSLRFLDAKGEPIGDEQPVGLFAAA